jgi:hypothetical protein
MDWFDWFNLVTCVCVWCTWLSKLKPEVGFKLCNAIYELAQDSKKRVNNETRRRILEDNI